MCGEQVHLVALALGFLQEKAHLGDLVPCSPQGAGPMHLTLQSTDCLQRLARRRLLLATIKHDVYGIDTVPVIPTSMFIGLGYESVLVTVNPWRSKQWGVDSYNACIGRPA